MAGPGAISDAEQPFVDALTAGARAAVAEAEGDRRVIDAFQLGWLMGDVINARSGPPFPVDVEMPESAGFKYQARRLTTLVGSLKLDRIDPGIVVAQLAEGVEAKDVALKWRLDLAAAGRGQSLCEGIRARRTAQPVAKRDVHDGAVRAAVGRGDAGCARRSEHGAAAPRGTLGRELDPQM